jgi:hypothetical protein
MSGLTITQGGERFYVVFHWNHVGVIVGVILLGLVLTWMIRKRHDSRSA